MFSLTMPKVTMGRRRMKTSELPYQRTPEKESKRPTRRATSSNAGSSSTSSNSTTGKLSNTHIKKLEALARATTKLKLDFINAASSGSECLPWVDRNFPQNLSELFVHSKKVNDVKSWMEKALNSVSSPFPMKMCLFTGPTGTGKTATAYLVAKELNAEVKEWINPMNLTEYKEDRVYLGVPGDEVLGRSQVDMFSDFLLRSSQYSSLPIKGMQRLDKRIIIVEDFPNTFYRDSQTFHNILRNYAVNGVNPIVFIIPDSASGDYNPIKLFPKQLMQELNITQISFNPVAITLMTKFLTTVCQRENVSVEHSIIDNVANASAGDLRCAINTLQFKILQEKPQFKRPQAKKPRRDKMYKNQDLTQKDNTLYLFRSIGKVLYNKRDRTVEAPIELELNEHLVEHRRRFPTQDVPEDIADKIEVSTDTFLGFLHQNYPNFFSSVETCAKAAGFLADAELLLSKWTYDDNNYGSTNFKNQNTREQLALSVGIRGLMYANDTKVTSEWRPLKKPLCGDIRAKVVKTKEDARALLSSPGAMLESYYYESIPFYAKGLAQFLKPDQRNLIRDIGLMKDSKQSSKPRWLETLDEKAIIETEATDGPEINCLSSSLIKSSDTQPEVNEGTPEDYFIDDFSDDD